MDTPRPIDLSVPSAGAIQDHRWVRFGSFELHWIETGDLWLDGGAMFGVVPKALWSRQLPPDAQNRIPMTMRCLLIRSLNTGHLYLVDNGAGNKFNEKMTAIYGLVFSILALHQIHRIPKFFEPRLPTELPVKFFELGRAVMPASPPEGE